MNRRFNSLEIDAAPPPAPSTPEAASGEAVKDAQYFLDAGDQHFYRLEYEPALKDYSRATGIDPGAKGAWTGQVFCLVELEEYREAELWYKKAVEIAGEDGPLLALRALIAARTADFEKACGFADAALEARGASPLPYIVRGEVFLYAKRNVEYNFNQACAIAPDDWRPRILIANACLFSQQQPAFILGLKFLQTFVDLHAPQPETLLALGRIQAAMGKTKLARSTFEQAATLCPEMTQLRHYLRATAPPKGFFARLLSRLS